MATTSKAKTTKKPVLQATTVEWLIIVVLAVALMIGLVVLAERGVKQNTSSPKNVHIPGDMPGMTM